MASTQFQQPRSNAQHELVAELLPKSRSSLGNPIFLLFLALPWVGRFFQWVSFRPRGEQDTGRSSRCQDASETSHKPPERIPDRCVR